MRVRTHVMAGGGAAYAAAHAPARLRLGAPAGPAAPTLGVSTAETYRHEGSDRLLNLDALRGIAVLMMVSLHGLVVMNVFSRELVTGLLPGWHLVRIGFAIGTSAALLSAVNAPGADGAPPPLTPKRLLAAGAVLALWLLSFQEQAAGVFMFLMGIALVLAERRDAAREGRPRPMAAHARRVAQIGAAALLVSAVSILLAPHLVIRFGILHMLALATAIAAPFLRLPATAALAAAIPAVAAGMALDKAPIFTGPLGLILGGGRGLPEMADHFPLLPGLGFVLAGIATGRVILRGGESDRRFPLPERPDSPTMRRLAAVGRNSLPVYLAHIPIYLLGLTILGDDAMKLLGEAIDFPVL